MNQEIKSWDNIWEKVHSEREWGKYPGESLIRFIARNFYQKDRSQIKILEVGFGQGANLWYIAREGFQAYGVEGSESAVNKARQRMKEDKLEATLHAGDIINLGIFENNFFDAVIDVECIYCNTIANSTKIFEEIKRVLKPGGLFYSRTFSDKLFIGNDAPKIAENEYSDATAGPLAGKGYLRLTPKERVSDIYSPYFKIRSVDDLDWTQDNGKMLISEIIIVAEKK